MKILYVCRANVGRSQMAEAFHRTFYPVDKVVSAGTHVHDNEGKAIGEDLKARFVWEVMDEEGIEVRDYKRNQLTEQISDEADKIILITHPRDWPDYLINDPRIVYWDLEDAKGTDFDFHVKTRDEIKSRVKDIK